MMAREHASARQGFGHVLSLACLTSLAACAVVPPPSAPPPPRPTPAPAPAPAPPLPPPPPAAVETQKPWDVAPLTPGDWHYEKRGADSVASFGSSTSSPVAALRCDRASRQIILSINGAATAPNVPVMIRTTSGTLAWNGRAGAADHPSVQVMRLASDGGFNWIAYSRGRISVEAQGLPRLILPVWAEISRVIEDCRS